MSRTTAAIYARPPHHGRVAFMTGLPVESNSDASKRPTGAISDEPDASPLPQHGS